MAELPSDDELAGLWLESAKTDTTRQRRIAEALEWIAGGKGRFWKYEK